ncbi:type VI secretion system protein [Chitinimonas koreensis]|uniref:type VI secretion system protein n=1 Tax=Chitinimonas koreensis TaxID=356302 RepID=UPI0016548399|nr:type VI secretion system protein [Chitinimonas koreensis]QNM95338.1 hypothetical protein H9L41_15870 [Chitinimonas koreensis]
MDLSAFTEKLAGLDWLLSPLMLLAAAALLVVLAGWLLVRARRPVIVQAAKPKPKAKDDEAAAAGEGGTLKQQRQAMLRWLDGAMNALRYLSTRREWRYHSPWVLLLGEPGGGKSSLVGSLGDGRREAMLLREKQLPVKDTEWHFCSGGVVIDPEGRLPAAEDGTPEARRWQRVLDAIDTRRPERPLDAVVLAVPADMLQAADPVALETLAAGCYRQLWQLQKRFEFVLPVYLVVTRCDRVAGYGAFWSAQPEARRSELWGWSNPSPNDHEETDTLARLVFEELGTCLRQLQIEAAATREQIEAADDFFLFPQRFAQLRRPLAGFLGTVLKPSAYHASFYFRGVYFTGSMESGGTLVAGQKAEVDFADGLFVDKVFREPGLARPVRQSIWSRNQLIRKAQIAGVSIFAFLTLALGFSAWRLEHQVESMKQAITMVDAISRQSQASGRCIERGAVYQVLEKIGSIRADIGYAAIPASWFDSRVIDRAGQWLARKAFSEVVMPSLACQLEGRARQLVAANPSQFDDTLSTTATVDGARARLRQYVESVVQLERDLDAFRDLARPGGGSEDAERQVREFEMLTQSVYGAPPPQPVIGAENTYRAAIVHVAYDKELELPADFKTAVAEKIRLIASALHDEVLERVELGGKLLQELDRGNVDTVDGVVAFQDWLGWMRANWLDSGRKSNLCQSVAAPFGEALKRLHAQHGYPAEVEAPVELFSQASCFRPAYARMAGLVFVPHGPLFNLSGGTFELNRDVLPEVAGFAALQKLPFMHVKPRRLFSCQVVQAGWRDEQLAQASGYLRDYQVFALARKLNTDDGYLAAPLYDRLARRQLRAVLDDTLVEAQRSPNAARGEDEDAESVVAKRSTAFARQVDPLGKLYDQLVKIDYTDGAGHFDNCVRGYASDMLARIDTLAEASKLYQPKLAGEPGEAGLRPVYQLGDPAEVKEYLSGQRERAAALANYAEPFVRYLDHGPAGSAVGGNAGWRATLDELKRFKDGKDGGAALGELENFIGKTLAPLDYDNCATLLAKAGGSGVGLDLFSQRRRALTGQSLWRCQDRREADAYERYRTLANRFNRELAGRYPFADAGARDLDLKVARDFFRDYAGEREALHRAVDGLKPARWNEIRRFLDRLDAVADFAAATLAAADGSRPVRLDLGFRALPRLEVGAEQLIGWRVASGASQIEFPGSRRQLDWAWARRWCSTCPGPASRAGGRVPRRAAARCRSTASPPASRAWANGACCG